MKRDMDLVREILLHAEALSSGYVNDVPELEGYTEEQVGYHIYLMEKAGLVDAADSSTLESDSPSAILLNVTWQGHDFLDSIRDPEIWKQTKEVARRAGGFSFELLGDLAKGLLKTQIEKYTGLKL